MREYVELLFVAPMWRHTPKSGAEIQQPGSSVIRFSIFGTYFNVSEVFCRLGNPGLYGADSHSPRRCHHTKSMDWDIPPYTRSSLFGIVVPPIRIPIKDCQYKGEHPIYGPQRPPLSPVGPASPLQTAQKTLKIPRFSWLSPKP